MTPRDHASPREHLERLVAVEGIRLTDLRRLSWWAARLGRSRSQVHRWARQGLRDDAGGRMTLRVARIGGALHTSAWDVIALMEAHAAARSATSRTAIADIRRRYMRRAHGAPTSGPRRARQAARRLTKRLGIETTDQERRSPHIERLVTTDGERQRMDGAPAG